MPIVLNRRELNALLTFASRAGTLASLQTAIDLLVIPDACANDSVSIDPQRDLRAAETLQGSLHSYVNGFNQTIQQATDALAKTSYTPSVGASIQLETGGVFLNASGGIVASFNFHTGHYVLPSLYGSYSAGNSSSPIPRASMSAGGSLGFGDISGFYGSSTVLSAGPATASYNDQFVSLGTQFTFGTSGGTMSQTSETRPLEEPQRGNVLRDIQQIENTLWNMSQDPFMGTYR